MKENLLILLRFGVSFLFFTGTLSLSADPITREQALERAQSFLNNKRGDHRLTPVTRSARLAPRHQQPPTGTDLYYVFDRGTDQGFVIVSGDDQTPAVLGYTDEGHFDYSQAPEAMREWLDDYAQQIAEIQREGRRAAELPVAALKTHDPIEQLMVTKWNQGSPYNNLCPDYFGQGTSVTGCVATAMAQILYYHHQHSPKELLADIPDYVTKNSHDTYGDMAVPGFPAGALIDWDNMQPTYNNNSTPIQKYAVARLMSYCGVSVRMGYSNSGSGAYSGDVPEALQTYFGYPSTCRLIDRSDMTEERFDEAVYAELAKGDPVYLSGSNGSGGHAFVADGYDGNLCYHINWGWGGGSDGHFMLAKLNPSSQGIGGSDGGYSGGQAAIIGIHMDNWNEKTVTFSDSRARAFCTELWDADADGKLTYAELAAVKDLGTAFKGAAIRTLNELYYCTSLTEIPDDAFAGCTTLTSIRLPRGVKKIGARAFEGCTALKILTAPEALQSVGEAAFAGCTKLAELKLPEAVAALPARTFEGCSALTEMVVPPAVKSIGDRAFADCKKLASLTFMTLTPKSVVLGKEIFDGMNLAAATLNGTQGADDYFATTAPWNAFGNLTVRRSLVGGRSIVPTVDQVVYVYNVGAGKYLTRGEVSGTQGTVGQEAMRFRLVHTDAMPDGVFSFYSDDTGSTNHYFYRLTTNSSVGKGICATFVDGNSTRNSAHDMSAWWNIQQVSEGVYTLQTPIDVKGYAEGEFLGIDPSHASNYAAPTAGVYSDIVYVDHPLNCQWMFVPYDENIVAVNAAAEVLGHLLSMAEGTGKNVSDEYAVYADFNATVAQLEEAQDRVRRKLGFVAFEDEQVRDICLTYWDIDNDGEFSTLEVTGLPDIKTRFQGSEITRFDEFRYFSSLTSLTYNAFKGCEHLQSIVLPENIGEIGSYAFQNCTQLSDVEIQRFVSTISTGAFYGCSNLKTLRLHVEDPAFIDLSDNVFSGVDLSKSTLYVPKGSKKLYAAADVWKKFGEIREMRSVTRPSFSEFKLNELGYVYHIGTRKYLNRGEAYKTQAVVAKEGMKYQFKRVTSGGKTYYYLYSDETGNSNKNLFRSETDGNVGEGVRTCFVDGGSNRLDDKSAYWNLQYVEGTDHYFTLQTPEALKEYVKGEYLGINTHHRTNAVSGDTYGLYWDVVREGNEANCLWAWVSLEEVENTQQQDATVAQLQRYLQLAAERSIDAAEEQSVYDNLDATMSEINAAIETLSAKLGFIRFASEAVKQLCVDNWDKNIDGELSYDEAAAVTDIAEYFRANSDIKSMEELKHFTALTEVPENAFRNNSQMISIYLPEGVQKVGDKAFTSCNKLKYLAILNASTTPVEAAGSGLPSAITVFVPKAALDAYRADAYWSQFDVKEYTGIPVVTPDTLSRVYGASNARLTFSVTGAPVNGAPDLYTDIIATTPVGDHPIFIEAGTITTPGLVLKNGIYHVLPATLTVTAKSYTREVGEENPIFEYAIKGFKNKETEEILTSQPVFECDATKDSAPGEYEIRVSGAEAPNYVFEYVPGILTINPPVGVSDLPIAPTGRVGEGLYDLSGRKLKNSKTQELRNLPNGIFVTSGKKLIVK